MAPSPSAGKKGTPKLPPKPGPKEPTTPTRAGKSPASSTIPKLGQAGGSARSAAQGPASAAKGATDSAKGSTPAAPDTASPSLPPRPKAADRAASQVKEAAPETPEAPDTSAATDVAEDAKGKVEDTAEDTKETATETAEDTTEDAKGKVEDTAEEGGNAINLEDNDPTDQVGDTPLGKVSQVGNETGDDDTSTDNLDEAEPEPADDTEDATETEEDATSGARDTAGGLAGGARGLAGKAAGAAGEAGDKAAQGDVNGAAEGAVADGEDVAGDVQDAASDAVPDEVDGAVPDGVDDAVPDEVDDAVPDGVDDAVDGAQDAAGDVLDEFPVDLSILKGLEVGEGGEILGPDGEPFGQLEEGNPEDLIGQTIGDNGEILDEDGDPIGRAVVLPEKARELAEQAAEKAKAALPDISVLEGLEVGEGGDIMGPDGTPLGKITEGDPADLVGQKLNANGEILDEDGDVIGRAEVVPGEAAEKALQQAEEAAKDALPDIGVLEGLEVGEGGEILGADETPLGKIVEGNAEDLVGQKINEKGEILNDEGDVIGRAEVVPGEAADKLAEEAQEAAPEAAPEVTPDLSILDGRKINKKGKILDDEGEPIGQLTEDSDLAQCIGKTPNEQGLILNDEGDIVGRVEIVPGEAADALAEEIQEAIPKITADLSILAGKKINKKGKILDEEGEPIGQLTEDSDLKQCIGKIPNEEGLILNDDGDVIGKVELVEGEAADEVMKQLHPELLEQIKEAANEGAADAVPELPDLSILEGLKVNKKGEVLNEDGDPIARLLDGELADVAGKKINDQGEILDKDGNVIGRVELIQQEVEAGVDEALPELSILDGLKVNKKGEVVNEDGDPIARLSEGELADCAGKKLNEKGEILDSEGNVIGKVEMIPEEPEPESLLPPLSILEGLKCNKSGLIVDADGKPLGKLVEGDARKLSKSGAQCDAEGQFWDGRGHVIGRAETLEQEDDEEEPLFAGLEGLIVVEESFVEDENGNKVGILTEGDPKKLVGRAVDEDGDVLDKRGNVVGHAERWSPPEEEEPEKPDLSILKGLILNKQGNVIGPDGVPIARLVEGNAKELAGRSCDEEGQIWNDQGQVVGRCELIPEDQREKKPEGIFGGLNGLVVVEDGFVEDEDENRVGIVVEGDPKKLIGRAVDEDGDILDRFGNVKGHAEPWEPEEVPEEDLSILEGKIVNKAGNVVDEHGTIYGRIVDGDPNAMAGRKVDGLGQIWSDDGKVIGKAELIPGGERPRAEGPFSGFEGLIVNKEGKVQDAAGEIVGILVDGDPKICQGRPVDGDGDILDKAGNVIGKAERFEEEEKERDISPMSGYKVNNEGEVRDDSGNLIGKLTEGNLGALVGKTVDDNGNVVDNDGNKIGECTLIEHLQEDELTPEQLEELRKRQEAAEIAKKMSGILQQTIEKIEPVLKMITEVRNYLLESPLSSILTMTLAH